MGTDIVDYDFCEKTFLVIPLNDAFSKLGMGQDIDYNIFFEREAIILKEVKRRMMIAAYIVRVLNDDGWRVKSHGGYLTASHGKYKTFDQISKRLSVLQLDCEKLGIEFSE